MVWDRVTRGPAALEHRKVVKMSREAAEVALSRLLSPINIATPGRRLGQWQILYGNHVVDCRDEEEAKAMAQKLLNKRMRVSARLTDGNIVRWNFRGRDQILLWLSA